MKTFLGALLLCACGAAAAAQDAHHGQQAKQETRGDAVSAPILRGEAISPDALRISFADALKEPQKYADKTVVIEGVVKRVCQAEGCWLELGPKAPAEAGAKVEDMKGGIRVTFDHKFAVPKDASAMSFRAEGTLKVKTLSKEAVEHLVKDDGAKIETNPDGTANEVTFLATGVELWR